MVLINKFDIREEEKLNEVEGTLTSARYAEWLCTPKTETFDFDHYKAIYSKPSCGRRRKPIHSIPYSVAQALG